MLSNLVIACLISVSVGFNGHVRFLKPSFTKHTIKMVATAPPEKKLQKVELIKLNSNYLVSPLKEELGNEEIFVSPDAVVVLKYHGSYMQDNRDKRAKGVDKSYQFMLRLKSPCGEIPPALYKELDHLADTYGQGDLRITTRQAWQLHGIMKGDLKTVISTIMEAGSSTVGACGDVSRNVMCSPAPFVTPAYKYARQYSKVMAEPQSQAFTSLWQGEEKVAEMEYWMKDLKDAGMDIQAAMMKDTGHGIITSDPVEPLYGNRYLPRKFKMAVTVPGDNSLDIYINDIGLVVITDDAGELLGFNVMVGGGMGRTHNKDSTFARVADHFGFVSKDDVMELCKSILAAQRDHGNRDVRPNARMKYLVHTLGVDAFKKLVEVS
jgi:sulfite reductase (ferredoxin)